MKLFFFKIVMFVFLASCSNINFLLDTKDSSNFLKNKTSVYVSGWNSLVLKDILFSKIGSVDEKRFLLTIQASEKITKRSINENQVAQKIDYKITINYNLSDSSNKCPKITNKQVSSFSFTPKSSGYNFASDVLLDSLYKEAVLNNVNNFITHSNSRLQSYKCLNEN